METVRYLGKGIYPGKYFKLFPFVNSSNNYDEYRQQEMR